MHQRRINIQGNVTYSFLSLLSPADAQPCPKDLRLILHWTMLRSRPYVYPRYFLNDVSATDYEEGGLVHPEPDDTLMRPTARCGHRHDPDGPVHDNKTRR